MFAPNINPKISLDLHSETLTISCLNIDGGAKKKLTNDHPYIYNIIRSHNPHIMAFLDTRLSDVPDFNIPGYELVAFSKGDVNTYHHIGGVLVYKRIDVLPTIDVIHVNHDTDTIIISITVKKIKHFITFAYCRPYKKKNKHKINRFILIYTLKLIIPITNSNKQSHLLMGDFNARLGVITGDHNHAYNKNSKHLRRVLHQHSLDVVNSKFARGSITFVKQQKGKKASSIIDLAISNNTHQHISKFFINQNKKFKTHKPIICKMNIDKIKVSDINPVYTFSSHKSSNEKLIAENDKLTQSKLFQLNKMIDKLNIIPNMHNSDAISNIITYFTYYLLMRSLIRLYVVKRINSTDEWHNSNVDIAALNSEIRLDIDNDDRLKILENKYNECLNKLKQKEIDSNTDKILHYRTHNKQKFLKKLFISQNQQSIIHNLHYKNDYLPKNIAHHNYYKDLMQDTRLIKNDILSQQITKLHEQINRNTDVVLHNIDDIKFAIGRTNSIGAAGYDKITQPHLSKSGNHVNHILTIMFNSWSKTNHIPFFVKMGTITSIPKCKNADSPDKYRPITLLPIVYKVYERLILWQLNDYNVEQNIHTLQGGFRKERGVLEQLGTLRIVSESCVKKKKPLYTVCLDIKKAYDSVWRDAILIKLHNNFNVSIPTLSLIKDMLNNTYSAVCNNHYIYNPFNTTLGVVQGSVISPLLYGVFVNDLITELDTSNKGIHIGKFHIPRYYIVMM